MFKGVTSAGDFVRVFQVPVKALDLVVHAVRLEWLSPQRHPEQLRLLSGASTRLVLA